MKAEMKLILSTKSTLIRAHRSCKAASCDPLGKGASQALPWALVHDRQEAALVQGHAVDVPGRHAGLLSRQRLGPSKARKRRRHACRATHLPANADCISGRRARPSWSPGRWSPSSTSVLASATSASAKSLPSRGGGRRSSATATSAPTCRNPSTTPSCCCT